MFGVQHAAGLKRRQIDVSFFKQLRGKLYVQAHLTAVGHQAGGAQISQRDKAVAFSFDALGLQTDASAQTQLRNIGQTYQKVTIGSAIKSQLAARRVVYHQVQKHTFFTGGYCHGAGHSKAERCSKFG